MEGPGDNVLTKRLLLLHRVSSDIFQKVPSFSCLHLICWGNPGREFRSGSEKKNESHCKAFLFCFISFSVKTLATACLGLFCILSLLCADIWKSHISLCVVMPGWRLFSAFESSKVQMTHSSSLCWNRSSRKIHWDSYKQNWLLKHPFLTCTFLLCLRWFWCEHSSCFCCWSTYSVLCQNEETCKWCICFIKHILCLLIIKGIPYRFY